MKSIEQYIREALAEILEEHPLPDPVLCPPEELMALYLEGTLTGAQREDIVEHLASCPSCREIILTESLNLPEEECGLPGEPPAGAIERAKGLVKQRLEKKALDLVVRFCRDKLEILHTYLRPLPPLAPMRPMQPLRGGGEVEGPEPIRLEKTFAEFAAEVRISLPRPGRWSIKVVVRDTSSEEGRAPHIRVTLKDLSEQRVLQSTVVREGLAVLNPVDTGDYQIEFTRKGKPLGTMTVGLL